MIYDKHKGGRGHSFSWWNDGSGIYGSDPPADTPCNYCRTRYDQITNIHYCPEKYRLDHEPQLVLEGLEGPP